MRPWAAVVSQWAKADSSSHWSLTALAGSSSTHLQTQDLQIHSPVPPFNIYGVPALFWTLEIDKQI